MPSFTSTMAIMAALSVASASPLAARDICGVAPTGTASHTPLAQPADINTAALCVAQCSAYSGCECVLFGFVNNVYTCELFSVPASSIPPITDLVAYDIGCTNVPSIIPTASNPTGVQQPTDNVGTGASNANPVSSNSGAKKSSAPTAGNPTGVKQTRQNIVTGATHANPQNGIPAAGQAPLATIPKIGSLDACLAACKGNPACISYTFATGICILYA
ncbi:hypothetical protein OIDMADRAFT_33843 [Oidiodendron maius Zn]|uniref:Apple domain-containing protein n=1 Tax=Oidiodendron maius (strain Zn) TaxID=913774 RepID=A0A0C3GHZ3_OIDMZ|nr:hypothetical protein OIDMADRAFT_33843 [Oidiodendron maius Zn]